jgi:salicylate hydroxylase
LDVSTTQTIRSQLTRDRGPNKHCVFYPLKNKTEFNLVLLRPDNLPPGTRTAEGDLTEMRDTFTGWDNRLQLLVSCMKTCLKWKLCHMPELETWIRRNVVLLGDACHPSLPYQAQGAAMAVEDGAVLGTLLSKLQDMDGCNEHLAAVLKLYETLRKSRTAVQVQGSINNREMFHMPDGPRQLERDKALSQIDWERPSVWQWGDPEYVKGLMKFDAIGNANEAFDTWLQAKGNR